MARPKLLLKNIQITEAKRAHNCKANMKHRIVKGNYRLTVIEGRECYHYCLECAKKSISLALKRLTEMIELPPFSGSE